MELFPSSLLLQSIGMLSLSHQQGWGNNGLCHDTPPNTAPNCPADVMIALTLLRTHHYKGQLSTAKPSFTFEPSFILERYKNPTVIEQKGGETVSFQNQPSLSLSLSLSLSKGLQSDLSFGGCVRTTRPDICVQGSKNSRLQRLNGSFHCHFKRRNLSSIDKVPTTMIMVMFIF